ncbi:MAG: HNH endonuclease [Streptosporangiaceae bacterium]
MAGWVKPPRWRQLRAATFARYGRACWRCGRCATTVDHIVPAVLGGGHDTSNLRPCCAHCNYSTGATIGNRLRGQRVAAQPWRTAGDGDHPGRIA